MAPSKQTSGCRNCGHAGHYSVDCPKPQVENRCLKCFAALRAGLHCGRCQLAGAEEPQWIMVANNNRRPWMRLDEYNRVHLNRVQRQRYREWFEDLRLHDVRVFPPTTIYVQSPDWRDQPGHPMILRPCQCSDCFPGETAAVASTSTAQDSENSTDTEAVIAKPPHKNDVKRRLEEIRAQQLQQIADEQAAAPTGPASQGMPLALSDSADYEPHTDDSLAVTEDSVGDNDAEDGPTEEDGAVGGCLSNEAGGSCDLRSDDGQ